MLVCCACMRVYCVRQLSLSPRKYHRPTVCVYRTNKHTTRARAHTHTHTHTHTQGPVISVHVRHGDACMHASISQFRPQCVAWSAYLKHIYDIRDRYGVSTVSVLVCLLPLNWRLRLVCSLCLCVCLCLCLCSSQYPCLRLCLSLCL